MALSPSQQTQAATQMQKQKYGDRFNNMEYQPRALYAGSGGGGAQNDEEEEMEQNNSNPANPGGQNDAATQQPAPGEKYGNRFNNMEYQPRALYAGSGGGGAQNDEEEDEKDIATDMGSQKARGRGAMSEAMQKELAEYEKQMKNLQGELKTAKIKDIGAKEKKITWLGEALASTAWMIITIPFLLIALIIVYFGKGKNEQKKQDEIKSLQKKINKIKK